MRVNVIFKGKGYIQIIRKNLPMFIIVLLMIVFGFFLMFDLGRIPGLYIDETNYMNEVISKVSFGTDIHGLRHPIYFASVWGQGQSVLYAWIVAPFIKLFGFSIYLFRAPMAILSILTILGIIFSIYFSSKDKFLAVCVAVSLVTTPWLFISSRWVLDANISPIFVMLGLVFMYESMIRSSKRSRYIWLVFSAIFLALSAYGYVASWMYLPFLVVALIIASILKKWFSIQEMLIWSLIIFVIALPLVVFAYRVNIQHINKFSKFLFFDFPYLQANRVSSLISFKGSILGNIRVNVNSGIKQVIFGTDSLPQNSVAPYGAIFPFMLVFTFIGLLARKSFFNDNMRNFHTIVLISLFSFVPGMLVIKPNYNHWNFLWLPLAILTGYGLYLSFQRINKISWSIFLAVPVVIFWFFIFNFYFGFNNQENRFNNSNGSIAETQVIDHEMTKNYKHNKLYIESLPETFNIFRLSKKPISDSQYLLMENKAMRSSGSIVPAPSTSYGYLRDVENVSHASKGDLAMIYEDDLNNQGYRISNSHEWHVIANSEFNHRKVKIFQKE